ncbi:uncharacterized protein LOC132902875 [Amyelois transitella]|uniref:uncharacterized protein LOC132902875 n=1 Tax=Amyelois transitella TaxID=680683 RepID=UPI0029900028|nr:uncharacterized protein LOC132902875 [Amyelois transitella]
MSTPDVYKGYVSRPITASTRPSLDEVDEIMYSENQQQNEEVEAIDSCCTSNGINSREYASSVSKSLTYDIFKRYFQMNPQFAFENNSDITLDGAAKNPEDKDPKNEKTADDSVASARRRNSIGLNYEVPSETETDLKLLPLKVAKHESVETSTTVNKKTSENTNEIKTQRQDSLSSIECKLEVLIQSINTLVTEIKAKPVSQCLTNNSKMTISRSIETVPPNTEPVLQKLDENRISQLKCNSPCLFQNTNVGKIDKILLEEINKSNEVKKDIENILNGNVSKSCAVQITADHIPTREHSTEVTDSLLKTEVNSTVDQQRMIPEENRTMAVNTDPLGLLALLRISKESVKHVLSYMQNFPYQYLLQLPFPKENSITPFICSICRAGFTTPSLLTEHTQSHVRNRDCCVCRHLTGAQANDDKALNPRRMFCCEFCRKPFSRAYCCFDHIFVEAFRLIYKICASNITTSLGSCSVFLDTEVHLPCSLRYYKMLGCFLAKKSTSKLQRVPGRSNNN